MTKHTPAPWVVGDADWSDRGFARYEIENVREICAPDARLIAAAPDLFDALDWCMNMLMTLGIGYLPGDMALAKARGSSADDAAVPTEEEFRKAGFTQNAAKYPRSEAAFRMLCAFNGVAPEQAPPAWRYYPNQSVRECWERVASVALRGDHS